MGSFFRANRAYALSVAPLEKCFILSAKYGIVRFTQELEPYEKRLGAVGCVTASILATQCKRFGLEGETALVLGGADYREIVKGLFAREIFAVDQMREEGRDVSMGNQIQWMLGNLGRTFWTE